MTMTYHQIMEYLERAGLDDGIVKAQSQEMAVGLARRALLGADLDFDGDTLREVVAVMRENL